MSSQPCEEFFRKIRSFTSTYSTQVNFSVLEIIQRIKKTQLQGDIILRNKENIKFPRLHRNLNAVPTNKLLENKEIFDEIEKARNDAISTFNAAHINIEMTTTKESSKSKPMNDEGYIQESQLNACAVNITNDDDLIDHEEDDFNGGEEEDEQHDDVVVDDDLLEDANIISSLTGELMLKDYGDDSTGDNNLPSKKNILTKIEDSTGKKKNIRKSTLLWVLVSNPDRLSSDHLQRVQVKSPDVVSPRLIGVLATWHKLVRESKNSCTFFEFQNDETESSSGTFNGFLDIRNSIGTVKKPSISNDELKLKNFKLKAVLEISSYLKKGKLYRSF